MYSGGSLAGWHCPRQLGRDAEAPDAQFQSCQGERHEQGALHAPPLGGRGGQAIRGGRRIWVSRQWRSNEFESQQADCNRRDAGGRKEEENMPNQDRAGLGRCKPHWRVFDPWWWKEERCSPPGFALDFSSGSIGDRQPHREVDVGRSAQSDAGARAISPQHECQELGGVQVEDWQFQNICPLCLERGGYFGCNHCWRCCPGTGASRAAPADAGSMQHRPWILGARFRAFTGRHTAVCFVGDSSPSSGLRRRVAVLKAVGPSLGRDQPISPAGSGRVPQPQEECRQGAECSFDPEHSRRGAYVGCRAEKKGKAKSKGQSRPSCPAQRSTGVGGGAGAPHAAADGASKKVPGAAACPVRVDAFLNSFPRWLLKVDGCLRDFFRSILNPGAADSATSRAASIWPMPLPYPEVFVKDGHKAGDAPWKRLVCLQVMVFDWLVLNRPRKAPACLRLGQRLTSRQWPVVKNLEFLARDGNSPELVLAHDMGRAASKVEGFQEELDALCRAAAFLHAEESSYFGTGLTHSFESDGSDMRCGALVGALGETAVMTAKPLVAERLSFPPQPAFNPRPFFDEETLRRYDQPLSDGLDPATAPVPPKVQIRATRGNKLALLRMMARSGMLQPLEPGTFPDKYRSGLFAVHKDENKDRMVLDGRPANLLDKGQSKWCAAMASASALAGICLEDNRVLIGSGEDLKDYFYQFMVNPERTSRNVLACDLCEAEAKEIFGQELQWHAFPMQVGLSTLAMGDKCACEFAQCAHIALCLQHDVCQIDEIISLRGAIPRGLLQVSIIVDDLVILEQVLRSSSSHDGWFERTQSAQRVKRVRAGYAQARLLNNPKKAFEGETLMKFWGCEIDGAKGILRCSSSRLRPTVLITMRTAMLGLATVGLLEALAGCWVSLLSVRRRLYCLLDCIFEPLGLSDRPRQVLRLSQQMKDEMQVLCVVGTLAAVNLRAQYTECISATDASMSGMGSVRGALPKHVAKELARHCLKKGNWSKLLPPGKAWLRQHDLLEESDELPAEHYVCHPFWEVIARGIQYKEAWRLRVERPLHINILELRAFLREERFLCSSLQHLRTFHGLDSQVCLGALVKGRAASKALNAELQRNLAYPIGSDVYGNYMFFQTQFNRADGPSRGGDVDPPGIELPAWFVRMVEGDLTLFDVWMQQQAGSFLPEQPPFQELCSCSQVVLKPASKCGGRRKRKARKHAKVVESPKNEPDPFYDDHVPSLLCEEAKDLLRSFPKRQYLFGKNFNGFSCPGAVDLFSGSFGVAKQMIKWGAPFVLTFEWNRSTDEDLLNPAVRERILRLLRLRAFSTFGAAPICSSFSRAVTPPVRSMKYPRGKPGLRLSMRLKVSQGNSHSDFVSDCRKLEVKLSLCTSLKTLIQAGGGGRKDGELTGLHRVIASSDVVSAGLEQDGERRRESPPTLHWPAR